MCNVILIELLFLTGNYSTGQHADPALQKHLTRVKELGLNALSCSISGYQKKTSIVKLKTFHTQNAKPKKVNRAGCNRQE